MKLYLAGPMRGYPHYNFQAFEDITHAFRHKVDIVSPHDIDIDEGWVYADYQIDQDSKRSFSEVRLAASFDFGRAILRDLRALATCDGLILMSQWEWSVGARILQQAAAMARMPQFTYRNIFGEHHLIHDDDTPTVERWTSKR